jgi:Family of unknown function (DUF6785)/Domain of unknown function (DUF6784)
MSDTHSERVNARTPDRLTAEPAAPRTPATAASPPTTFLAGPLRARALVLGVLLILANHVWIVYLEIVRYSFPTIVSPFFNAIFCLFLLTLANMGFAHRGSRLALNRLELLAIYVMISVASALHSSDMLGVLVAMIAYPHWFATSSNKWGELFLGLLPGWSVVSDPIALRDFYAGNTTLYHGVYLRAWLAPVLAWSLFTLVLGYTLLCLTLLLRRQWIERERLTFPIVELPFQMTAGAPFFQSRLLWLGFALTSASTLLNGLAYLYPSIPSLPLKRQSLAPYLTEPPWNAIAGTNLSFYPFGIALSFLMPLDLSFSAWFFYLLYKGELVISAAAGWGRETRFPYHQDQAFGAYMAIFLFVVWSSRRALLRAVRAGLSGDPSEDEGLPGGAAGISSRHAFWAVTFGFLFLVGFAMAAGMDWWLAAIFFTIYFALAILMSRIRCELGFPVIDMHFTQVPTALVRMHGSEVFGPHNLAVFGLFLWFNRVYRSHPMPHMMEGFKLADRVGQAGSLPGGERREIGQSASGPDSQANRQYQPARALYLATVVALLVAIPTSFWAYLDMYYRRGAGTSKVEIWALGFGREFANTLANWIRNPTPPDTAAQIAALVGFTIAVLLALARMRFFWFPLHPLAYAVANGWGMHNLWSCVLVGWLIKALVLRYGGLRRYRELIPFFLGLMLGEFFWGSLWTLYGIALDIRTYDFWP